MKTHLNWSIGEGGREGGRGEGRRKNGGEGGREGGRGEGGREIEEEEWRRGSLKE